MRSRYYLSHLSSHPHDSRDHERLWKLLQDKGYRRRQIQTFKRSNEPRAALQMGLELYVARQGRTRHDDPRLCRLALQCAQLSSDERSDFRIAFEWAPSRSLHDPRRLEDVLTRLSPLNEGPYFSAGLLLLQIESERMHALPQERRTASGLSRILESMTIKIPPGAIVWTRWAKAEFVAWTWWRFLSLSPWLSHPATASKGLSEPIDQPN